MNPLRFSFLPVINQGGSSTTLVLNASTTKFGARWRAPKTGPIDRIAFWATTVVGTPTLRVGIQGWGSNHFPDGTWIQSATVIPSVNANIVTIPTVNVTVDGKYCTVIEYDSGATSATCRTRHGGTVFPSVNSSTNVEMTAGTWATNNNPSCAVTLYADGDAAYYATLGTDTAVAYTDATNPDEQGNKFIPDESFYCNGVYYSIRDTGSVGATAKIALFNNVGTELASVIHDVSTDSILTSPIDFFRYWEPVLLQKDQTYYISIKATGTGNISTYSVSSGLAVVNSGLVGNMVRVTRNNLGSWSEDPTAHMIIHPLKSDAFNVGVGVPIIGTGGLISGF